MFIFSQNIKRTTFKFLIIFISSNSYNNIT